MPKITGELKSKVIQFKLTPPIHERLEKIGKTLGLSANEYIREVSIQKVLEDITEEKKA